MKNVRIAARIPEKDDGVIEHLVEQGRYLNKSDFFRQAIRKLLEVKTQGNTSC